MKFILLFFIASGVKKNLFRGRQSAELGKLIDIFLGLRGGVFPLSLFISLLSMFFRLLLTQRLLSENLIAL